MRNEHVFICAIVIETDGDRATAEQFIHDRVLGATGELDADNWPGYRLDSWWIAEDDRRDGSDLESAVFIPGDANDPVRLTQSQARMLLEFADSRRRAIQG